MLTARDNLFLDRMDHFISLFESTDLRKKKVFIRPSTRKVNNRTVIEYLLELIAQEEIQQIEGARGLKYLS